MTSLEKSSHCKHINKGYWVAIAIGIITFLLPHIFYYWGCSASNWTCTGDDMGGVMMLFALSVMPISFLVAVVTFLIIVKTLVEERRAITGVALFGVILYLAVFSLSTYELVVDDMATLENTLKQNASR